MTEGTDTEPTDSTDADPEPLKLDVPVYDYIKKSEDGGEFETRKDQSGESDD